jgi:hypothetical protein
MLHGIILIPFLRKEMVSRNMAFCSKLAGFDGDYYSNDGLL